MFCHAWGGVERGYCILSCATFNIGRYFVHQLGPCNKTTTETSCFDMQAYLLMSKSPDGSGRFSTPPSLILAAWQVGRGVGAPSSMAAVAVQEYGAGGMHCLCGYNTYATWAVLGHVVHLFHTQSPLLHCICGRQQRHKLSLTKPAAKSAPVPRSIVSPPTSSPRD